MLRRRTLRKLEELGPDARQELLAVLAAACEVRADVIKQLYERPEGRVLAEVLMDLEEDDALGAQVIEALRSIR